MEERLESKKKVFLPFAKAAIEIWKPLPSERCINSDFVSRFCKFLLEILAYTVEHLEFDPIGMNLIFFHPPDQIMNDTFIMRRKSNQSWTGSQKELCEMAVIIVHIFLLREGELRAFLVCAFHKPDIRMKRNESFNVRFRSAQIGLDANTKVFFIIMSKKFIHGYGAIRVGGTFHVEPDKIIQLSRPRKNLLHVFFAEGLIYIQTELRQFDGYIRIGMMKMEGFKNANIGTGRFFSPSFFQDILAQKVAGSGHATKIQPADRAKLVPERISGNISACKKGNEPHKRYKKYL
ncbi:MAG TPA: hypothetical protein VI588_03880 [Candidatus Gracilibacteria bacterium]|nr:hypothetical protein [Candidatus Gracilibacteria bacterium]